MLTLYCFYFDDDQDSQNKLPIVKNWDMFKMVILLGQIVLKALVKI